MSNISNLANSMISEVNDSFVSKRNEVKFTKEEFLDFSYLLGEVVPSGKGHPLVDDIVTNNLSGEAFVPMHNDKSYWSIPPRYLVMYIAEFAGYKGGFTELSDMMQAFALLSAEEQKYLREEKHIFTSPKNREFKQLVGNFVNVINDDNFFFRYRVDLVTSHNAIVKFDEIINVNKFEVEMVQGSLVVIDNWRISHGREMTEFSEGGRRVMYRTLIL